MNISCTPVEVELTLTRSARNAMSQAALSRWPIVAGRGMTIRQSPASVYNEAKAPAETFCS